MPHLAPPRVATGLIIPDPLTRITLYNLYDVRFSLSALAS